MAFNKDFFKYLMEELSGKATTYTTSCKPKKKFSDVANYVRESKFYGKSEAGQVSVDTDTGALFHYKYLFDRTRSSGRHYEVKVFHAGETILNMEVKLYDTGAAYYAKKSIAKMEAALKDFESNEKQSQAPKIDYSSKEFYELLDIIDQKIQAFANNACISTFNEIVEVKIAIDMRINTIPLDQRGKYSKAMSDLNLYVSTLKTQLANPHIDVNQFVGTYVPQMQIAISELASLINK